ncbi:MAG: pseudouridine synthase [Lachnospiraceae bacterium]|nr:pseudouridine synthase [Lachnospiraceae bacterium]
METRLNKYLAQCGVCSRREADKLIEAGKVFVNGQVAGMGTKVTEEDEVRVGKKILGGKSKTTVLAFYKPVGVTCTEKDKYAEKIINDYINLPFRVTYAGRLDKDSEGLLLLTNDGDLIDAIMRGAHRHEKEYVVKVNKEITPEFVRDMEKGVYLKELEQTTRTCQVKAIGKYTFHITLTQGLNRQIRRMCKTLGYEVTHLKRIRIMNVELGKLIPGKYRELTGEELEGLYRLAGIKK